MVPQPLSQQESVEAFLVEMDRARNFIASGAPQSSPQWFNNMQEQFKHRFKCVDDNRRHANRRMCLPYVPQNERNGPPKTATA